MRIQVVEIALSVMAGFALVGCNTAAVVDPHVDANISGSEVAPDLAPDIADDTVAVQVKLDVPAATETAPQSCISSDGATHCVNAGCGNGILEGAEECDDGNTTSGEGCTADCKLETDWACPTPGSACISIAVCGDGRISGNEACDDHNTVGDDGCSADCKKVTPGWVCLAAGAPCQPQCGDGLRVGSEQCDDGNTNAGDGCSATCVLEAGFVCPTPGKACHATVCGDGVPEGAEQCDDGNTKGGDGCSPQCTIEPDYVCPTAGALCVSTAKCGDSLIGGPEQCDDGNTAPGDGCSSTCQLESGWTCPVVGAGCVAKACGDGILAGTEQCDDGDTASGNGCSSTCQLEPGYACGPDTWHPSAPATQCYRTVCGDGHKEGTEQCDDGNLRPFDGCSPTCTNEPKCGYPGSDTSQAYQCFSVCGDGIKMPDEQCDDGNLQSGDGCSSTCKIEPGFACDATAPVLGNQLTIPILYRDFNWHHPQFEVDPVYDQRQVGIVANAVGVNGKPVFNSSYIGKNGGTSLGRPWTMDGPAVNTGGTQMADMTGATFQTKTASNVASLSAAQAAQSFAQWYTDDPNATGDVATDAANPLVMRITVQSTLTLNQLSAGTYQYYSSAFYPLDGLGFGNIKYPATNPSINHNYSFTSEAHYWFQYNGGEKLEFRGDDDVWVFVNGQLSVDLGGIHSELRGIVTLNGATTQVCVDDTPPACSGQTVCDTPAPADCTTITNGYNLVPGNIYEIVVFQSERHVTNSNYKLTLSGFNAPKSTCHSTCGDGIVTRGEACDLGSAKNTGVYGTCNPDCALPPRCGDKIVQSAQEQCDDGVNQTLYGGTSKKCGPNCKWAPYCGDGVVSNGEQCDEGAANGSGYGHCTAACTPGPSCGDGTVNGTEQCDNGAANSDTAYGGCTTKCVFGPHCGDGHVDTAAGEECDDGANVAKYGETSGCMPSCRLPHYCGDGHVDSQFGEECDNGAENGQSLCTAKCKAIVP